ncbi:MAG: ThuA domain-containing protein [Bacteroidota bacterium]|nr:ThuA domain-containing protein [Bacteroidota bacterium]
MKLQLMLKTFLILSITIALLSCGSNDKRILVFSKTGGFRHESIANGKIALMELGKINNIIVDTSENADVFNDDDLKKYSAIVFLSTTGNILTFEQKIAFERYIQSGGGFVGIHAATDTEYGWKWYNKLVGGQFLGHPAIQKATINIKDNHHESTIELPNPWVRTDEWYNFKNFNKDVHVLAQIDEKTYQGGTMGEDHPMIWYHEYDGGRAFYTACGHTKESYSEELFLKHILGGITYAIGENKRDYSKAKSQQMPDQSRFSKQIIKNNLNEPMALAISDDGSKIFFCERRGKVFVYEPIKGITRQIAFLKVEDFAGHGIMGMTLDPDFSYNSWVYIFHLKLDSTYRLSRFKYQDDKLDLNSEQIVFSMPFDREPGAHNGGTILFDKYRNLLISIGDNTPPWQANGYPPYDERPGRKLYNAQRTASNTQDLRGKILRIKPNIYGPGYTIPDGNLFDKSGKEGRPEIYAMGCRNPWRMSYDKNTNFVYWGEVGPDAGKDSTIGPRGYDEINQAKKPGNFGWPYFVANSKPYKIMDLVAPGEGALANVERPENNSPYNTGLKYLPKPTDAFIYYPYADSWEFPEVGKGGRTACAGPIYHFNDAEKSSSVRFPRYYDGKLFIFEWMRDWVKVVTTDKNGDYIKMEPFAPHLRFDHPTHMVFAPDGSLYYLEYGFIWYSQNENARLSRIIYSEGNRPPVAKLSLSDSIGDLPLKVNFDASKSMDPDGDKLSYEWCFEGANVNSTKPKDEYTFTKPGIYNVNLTIIDNNGARNTEIKKVIVGNTYPKVKIELLGSSESFYFQESDINYKINISDKEDKIIDPNSIEVLLNYTPHGKDIFPMVSSGHQETPKEREITENVLIAQSDCKSCHAFKKQSVGPSFYDIAQKYKNDNKAIDYLANKIIKGGSGVWGDHAMSAHPQLSNTIAKDMVKYILSIAYDENDKYSRKLSPSGTIPASEFKGKKGWFYITASYTDKGNNLLNRLTSYHTITLHPPLINAIDADSIRKYVAISNSEKENTLIYVGAFQHNSHIYFKDVDLTSIGSVTVKINSNRASGSLRIMANDPNNGVLLGSIPVVPQLAWEKWDAQTVQLKPTIGHKKLFFVFSDNNEGNLNLSGEYRDINILDIRFNRSIPFKSNP